jgi:hypothetical protein
MKRNYLEWFLLTAGGALVGALAVDLYKNIRPLKKLPKGRNLTYPAEILIIEKL